MGEGCDEIGVLDDVGLQALVDTGLVFMLVHGGRIASWLAQGMVSFSTC